MADNFDAFFKRVLEDEGTAYEDVRGDNGGPTKCGVTIFDVARFNGVKIPDKIEAVRKCAVYASLVEKVKALTPATARGIYKRYYWDDVRADDLPHGLDYAVADFATNSGEAKAASTLGSLVGVRGSRVNDAMVEAVSHYPSLDDLITHFQEARRAYLVTISDPSNPKYLHNVKFRKGWLDREARVRHVALTMAANHPSEPMQVMARAVDISSSASALVSVADHPVVAAAKSRTVWSLITAAFAGLYNGFEKLVDIVSGLFGSATDIQADAESSAAPIQSILELLKVDAAYIGTGIAVVCLVIAIVRHVDEKKPKEPA